MALPAGICDSWTPPDGNWACNLSTEAIAVSGIAFEAATEVLYALSGRRFGLCSVTLRPCRRDCYGDLWWRRGNWWEFSGVYPMPALIGGLWYNIACGGCGSGCSCSRVSEAILPGPVHEVTQVKIDGVTLTKNVDYRLDDWRTLIRLGGAEWPLCNNLNLEDTEVGTWSVTLQYGEPVPTLGQLAVGQLAAELAKAFVCDDSCALPKPVQSIARQGINLTFLDPNEVFLAGKIGMYVPDLFIGTYNPNQLTQRSRVYDLDNLDTRRQLGTG